MTPNRINLWIAMACVKEDGIFCCHTVDFVGYEWLMKSFEISHDNGKTWQKCEKDEVAK